MSDCKLTKGDHCHANGRGDKKRRDWGSLIHDSSEMSQTVESQRHPIPWLGFHYSIYQKSDGSKAEGGINDFL